ncbi:carbohydrate esterase family 16 protein [Moniliophthora roreri MCA 2997]|uniref:Carbohydrate esterase family 16 protein n=1 Tax=Moniliophthora roreri (strain MCA 2997) TaxID=1381753 RepID=V2X9Z0_MONRO|nr:carbohydrate esterase family 16 protein [Moniliophthora roreri MCA 2997]
MPLNPFSDVGARNFLFINVPPVNRSPLMISNSGASQEATVINGHNSRMATKIASFQASNAGVKTFSYDSYAAFTKILNNPTSYGFKDATSVGNAANNFWGDVYHPTSSAHKLFAQDIAALLVDTVCSKDDFSWTATGGENWIDFDTTKFNKSLILTYNFAYGGATIDANLVKPYEPTVRSLTDQVNIFLDSVGKKPANAPWTSKNALFSIWIGINDIGNSYYLSGDRGAFSDTLLNAEFALVQKLVIVGTSTFELFTCLSKRFSDAGARNLLFLNVPPIQRSPLMLAQSKDAQNAESTVINGFNSRLATKINSFKASHSGVTTYLYDTYAGFAKILDDPKSYGFKDATSYGSGTDMFWGNDYHPSSYAHKYFAQDVAKVLSNSIW